MIGGLILFLAIALAFGTPFTALGLGGAAALGSSIAVLGLFCATVFAGLAVSTASWILVSAAAMTIIAAAVWRRPRPTVWWLAHPIIWLPALVMVTAQVKGVPEYLPVNWDEMSGWASWVRQIMAADTWWRADMESSYPHYTKAWPILAAAMTKLRGSDSLSVGIGVLCAWHVSVLAAVYDVAVGSLRQRLNLRPAVVTSLAWILLLAVILGEATWKMLPPSYLIEHPQIYPAVAFFCFGFLALRPDPGQPSPLLSWGAAGIAMATAYAVKTPMAALSVAALVFLFFADERRKRAAAIFLPLALTVAGWSVVKPSIPSDTTALSDAIDRLVYTLPKLGHEFPQYLLSWKLPMTIAGFLGLALCFRTGRQHVRERGLAAALTTFTTAIWLGLLPLYMFAIWPYEPTLPSLPRYMSTPLRLVHLFGPVLLAVELLALAWCLPTFRRLLSSRPVTAGLPFIVIGLAALLSMMTARSIAAMATHPDFGREAFAEVQAVHAIQPTIDQAVQEDGANHPRVLVIDQGGAGFSAVILHFLSIRAPGPDPAPDVHRFRVAPYWSFGPHPVNMWMQQTDGPALRAMVSHDPVVWLYRLDSWARQELAPLIGVCPVELEGQVLRRNTAGLYDCVVARSERSVP